MTDTAPSRVVVLGAGAIGAGVGGLLWEAGVDVLLVARGAHGRALAEQGLDLRLPGGPRRLRVPVGGVEDVRAGDLVLLATMGHDSREAVAAVPVEVPIASFQNGLRPLEALADRPLVAGVLYVPAERRAPGVVALAGAPSPGAIFLGRWPAGGSVRRAGWPRRWCGPASGPRSSRTSRRGCGQSA